MIPTVFSEKFPHLPQERFCALIPREIAKCTSVLSGYTELRSQTTFSAQVILSDGKLLSNTRQSAGGVSARTMDGGVYGFASDSSMNERSVKEVLDVAQKNAAFLSGKVQKGGQPFRPADHAGPLFQLPPQSPPISQKDLIDFTSAVDAYLQKTYPLLKSRTLRASYMEIEKLLYVGRETVSFSSLPRSSFYVTMVFEKDGIPYETMTIFSAGASFQDHFKNPEALCPRLEQSYRQVVDKANGVQAEAGFKECVLSPDIAGILAHEAVGHTAEADLALAGSVAASNLGNVVASPLVSLTDFANTALGQPCPIQVFSDDEGVLARDVPIIEGGVLKNLMHNRETARLFGVAPLGNARAFAYSDEPLIRMRNTAILPGRDKQEEMIASIDDGYYCISTGNGQADTTGEFMFGVTMGYEIKGGKLGKAIRDTTISGIAFDVLKSVTMVGDDFAWCCSGFCGKKQPMITATGGPSMKCRLNIGGK